MNRVRITGLGVALGISLIMAGVFLSDPDGSCRDRYFQMESVYKCIQTQACIVFAEDMLKGRVAARYYEQHCYDYEQRRSFKERPVPKPEGSKLGAESANFSYK